MQCQLIIPLNTLITLFKVKKLEKTNIIKFYIGFSVPTTPEMKKLDYSFYIKKRERESNIQPKFKI